MNSTRRREEVTVFRQPSSPPLGVTVQSNAPYLIALGAFGLLLGRFVIGSESLASAGLTTLVIGNVVSIVSIFLPKKRAQSDEEK